LCELCMRFVQMTGTEVLANQKLASPVLL
jgi:hypothetical protein